MNIEIMTRNQIRAYIKAEVGRGTKRELDLLWKYINKFNDELKILKEQNEKR